MILEQDKMECDERGDGWDEGVEEEGEVSGEEEVDREREPSLADSGYSTSPVASDQRSVSLDALHNVALSSCSIVSQ